MFIFSLIRTLSCWSSTDCRINSKVLHFFKKIIIAILTLPATISISLCYNLVLILYSQTKDCIVVERERELGKAQSEIRALRATDALKDKAVEEVRHFSLLTYAIMHSVYDTKALNLYAVQHQLLDS